MNIKQRPRLDRRNANKNYSYDAASSSSPSSSFDDQSSTPRSPLLDPSPVDIVPTSFRVEGIDGQFDRICRSLGLSGPEDFAIPPAAWEARKAAFYPDHNLEDKDSSISDGVNGKLRVTDHKLTRQNGRSKLRSGTSLDSAEASDKVSDEVTIRSSYSAPLNFSVNSVHVRSNGSGIKGDRPPVLAPPPSMSPSVVDNVSTTWDIFRSFGPQHEEDLYPPTEFEFTSSSNEVEVVEEVEEPIVEKQESHGLSSRMAAVVEEVENQNVGKQRSSGSSLRKTAVLSDSHSETSNDYNEGGSISMAMDPVYFVSPKVKFRPKIMSWQKGDFLGSGSFGTVYEGFTDDGYFFAVKEVSLLDQGSLGKQSVYQLEQEISLLSQFEHDNIVQYLGTEKDDSKLYIFLELVTKGSLANLYQKYQLRDSQVSAYTRQILSGLNYLHARDVVHRDIKCANILVDVSGSVKLADFGLAKATKLNDIKSCKGTTFWMAPEVVNLKNQGYGLAADIWSLGCTVLEMLTRHIPYSHLEGMQALFRIGRGEPPHIPNSLSSDAQDFILKCLQVNPDHRPTAAELLDHPFVKRPQSVHSSPGTPVSPHYYHVRS